MYPGYPCLCLVVLADGGAPAVLASAPLSVVLVDGGAPAVLASVPFSIMLAGVLFVRSALVFV